MNCPNKRQDQILIVEDDQVYLDLLTGVLNVDFAVIPARSSAEACNLLADGRFSLVLLDWNLSKHRGSVEEDPTGSGVLKRCREIDPHLPVVVMSGLLSVDVRHDAILNEADSFLQKPFSLTLLARHVSRWIERTEAADKDFRLRNEADILPLKEIQRKYVHRVVEMLGGNVSCAAEKLNVHRNTVSSILGACRSVGERQTAARSKRAGREVSQ